MLNFFKKNFYINFFIIISIFSLDRVSKIYVINSYDNNLGNDLFSSKYLNIILIWNDGIAFGLFSDNNQIFYNIISIIILLIIIILFYLMVKTDSYKRYVYLIIIGGALGNLFDRIVYNSVPDFIDLHYQGFHWFIFNVADIFITSGVVLLIIKELWIKNYENN